MNKRKAVPPVVREKAPPPKPAAPKEPTVPAFLRDLKVWRND